MPRLLLLLALFLAKGKGKNGRGRTIEETGVVPGGGEAVVLFFLSFYLYVIRGEQEAEAGLSGQPTSRCGHLVIV